MGAGADLKEAVAALAQDGVDVARAGQKAADGSQAAADAVSDPHAVAGRVCRRAPRQRDPAAARGQVTRRERRRRKLGRAAGGQVQALQVGIHGTVRMRQADARRQKPMPLRFKPRRSGTGPANPLLVRFSLARGYSE